MEVDQINLAVEVRTGEREGCVSRHAVICCDWVGMTTGAVIGGGLVGDYGKEFIFEVWRNPVYRRKGQSMTFTNHNGENTVRCGMFFPGSIIQPKDLSHEIGSEASGEFGRHTHDAISLFPKNGGLFLEFKTDWNPHRAVFTISRESHINDVQSDLICMLWHERKTPEFRHYVSLPSLDGKWTLEWESVERLVGLAVRIIVRHAGGLDFHFGNDFSFWVSGDHSWLPETYRENITAVDNAAEGVTITIDENTVWNWGF